MQPATEFFGFEMSRSPDDPSPVYAMVLVRVPLFGIAADDYAAGVRSAEVYDALQAAAEKYAEQIASRIQDL